MPKCFWTSYAMSTFSWWNWIPAPYQYTRLSPIWPNSSFPEVTWHSLIPCLPTRINMPRFPKMLLSFCFSSSFVIIVFFSLSNAVLPNSAYSDSFWAVHFQHSPWSVLYFQTGIICSFFDVSETSRCCLEIQTALWLNSDLPGSYIQMQTPYRYVNVRYCESCFLNSASHITW